MSPLPARRTTVIGGVSVAHFLSHFYILVYPPLFPFFVDRFGLTNAELGLIMSVGVLGPLFLQVPVGRVVDDVGGKWTLVAGLALTAGGTGLVATADSYRFVLLFAAVAGLGQAAFHPADYALLETVTDPATRGRTFSVHTFGGYAGFAAAPAVVAALAGQYGHRLALAITGCVGIAYAIALAAGLPPVYRQTRGSEDDEVGGDTDDPEGLRRLLAPALLALFCYYLLTTVAIKGIQTFGPRFLATSYGVAASLGNVALTLFFVGASAGVLFGGRAADRFPEGRVIVAALVAVAACLTALSTGLLAGEALLAGTLTAVGVGVGVTLPARDSLVSRVSGADSGSSFGLVFTGLSLGGVLSPPVLGALADATALSTTVLAIALCYAASALVIVSLVRARADLSLSRSVPTGWE